MLKVEQLSYNINEKIIVDKVSLEVKEGEFIGIIGPNGSGKSTLLKNIYKVIKPTSGEIRLNNKDVISMSNKELSKELAVVAQENDASFDFTVEEVILMGTYPKKKFFEQYSEEDKTIVKNVLEKIGMKEFIDRSYLSLSGGEKQRTLIGRALAQETKIIILDEPTNHLDMGSQIKTLNLLKNSKKTVLTALHDLNMAIRFCDRIYVMKDGKVVSHGKPGEILNHTLIKELYDVDSEVFERNNRTYINFL